MTVPRTPGFDDQHAAASLSRGRPMGWGVAASLLLHAVFLALLVSGLVTLGDAPRPDAPIPVELAFLEEVEPEPAAEDEAIEEVAAEPEPIEEVVAEEPEPEAVEEEQVAEEEPEPVEEQVAEEPEPEPVLEEEVAEELEPEPAVEEVVVEEVEPEPVVEEEIAAGPEPEPEMAEEPALVPPLPDLAQLPSPPLPPRRPVVVGPEPSLEEPAEAPLTEALAEAPPEPEPSYVRQQDIERPAPDRFLANLAALRDEDAQARLNPELWEVIRAVRAQIEMCWVLDRSEARNPKLAVDIAVAFDRGGGVTKAQIQQVGQMVLDEDYKDFATKAHDALMACSPFALPPDKYAIWRSFTMRFVPRSPG